MRVIITLGGTQEPIDNVRKITNSSTGRFGIEIAKELILRQSCPKFISPVTQVPNDLELTLIAGKSAWEISNNFVSNYWLQAKSIRVVKVTTTEDLSEALKENLNDHVDVVIHSMAVSDYTTDFLCDGNVGITGNGSLYEAMTEGKMESAGKVASDHEHLAVVLKKTPKIIDQIKKWAPKVFLVGFKLLDYGSEEMLFEKGFDLLRRSRSNLVFCNDIQHIRGGSHDGIIVYPEKSFDRVISGNSDPMTKARSAKALVDAILRRYHVGHPQSVCMGNLCCKRYAPVYHLLHDMGAALGEKNFLPRVMNHETNTCGTYGNLSMRIPNEDTFAITGRNVNKSDLGIRDFCRILRVDALEPDRNSGVYAKVFYEGFTKPSIDAAIHAEIYRVRPDIKAIMHVHTQRMILMPEKMAMTDYNYPCGSMEEAEEIVDALGATNTIVQMRNHGLLICSSVSLQDCLRQLEECMNAPHIDFGAKRGVFYGPFVEHLKEIGFYRNHTNLPLPVFPIMIKDQGEWDQIGVLGEEMIYGGTTARMLHVPGVRHFFCYIDPNKRGHGIVNQYLQLTDPDMNKPMDLMTLEECGVTSFYETLGFKRRLDDPCSQNEYLHMIRAQD